MSKLIALSGKAKGIKYARLKMKGIKVFVDFSFWRTEGNIPSIKERVTPSSDIWTAFPSRSSWTLEVKVDVILSKMDSYPKCDKKYP